MVDERTRRLERRAPRGGAEDEARVLADRLRSGTLAPDRLELAAALGHEAAVMLGLEVTPVSRPRDLVEWGKVACVRAAASLALATLQDFEAELPATTSPREWVNATAFYALCPDALSAKLIPALSGFQSGSSDPAFHAARAAASVAGLAAARKDARPLGLDLQHCASHARDAAKQREKPDPWVSTRAGLVQWALGHRDELLEHLLGDPPPRRAPQTHASWPRMALHHSSPKRHRATVDSSVQTFASAFRKRHGIVPPDVVTVALAIELGGDASALPALTAVFLEDWRSAVVATISRRSGETPCSTSPPVPATKRRSRKGRVVRRTR